MPDCGRPSSTDTRVVYSEIRAVGAGNYGFDATGCVGADAGVTDVEQMYAVVKKY